MAADHYMVPPASRLPGVRDLVEQKLYFVLHAPRQVGKTTSLIAFARTLTDEGRFASVLLSMEAGAAFPDDPDAAQTEILASWANAASVLLPPELRPPRWSSEARGARLLTALTQWSQACPRPLVLFLDEIDALEGNVLVSVLRQLRDGHKLRPGGFPWSLALVGMRDVRDYKIASGGVDRSHGTSPFNVLVESLTMRNFNAEEVAELYAQHTTETGQRFAPEAVALSWELSQGQPWLVNALARQAVERFATDRAVTITADVIMRAKDELVRRQDTHLDSLAERLRERRVRSVMEPLLAGDTLGNIPDDDRRFVIDLGLLRHGENGSLEVANPIYREVMPRALTQTIQDTLPGITPTWLRGDGSLDPDALLQAFLSFWRQHGEVLQLASPYPEVAPHLVLMAFVHRVVNGGGRVEREYALGRGRLDLLVEYRGERLVIELKTWRDRDKKRDPVVDGLVQIDEYLAHTDATRGWLVVFDQRKRRGKLSEGTKVERAKSAAGRSVVIVRL